MNIGGIPGVVENGVVTTVDYRCSRQSQRQQHCNVIAAISGLTHISGLVSAKGTMPNLIVRHIDEYKDDKTGARSTIQQL